MDNRQQSGAVSHSQQGRKNQVIEHPIFRQQVVPKWFHALLENIRKIHRQQRNGQAVDLQRVLSQPGKSSPEFRYALIGTQKPAKNQRNKNEKEKTSDQPNKKAEQINRQVVCHARFRAEHGGNVDIMLPFIEQKENGKQEENDISDPSECREQKLLVLRHKETNDKERVHEQVLVCIGKQGNKQHPH